MNETNQSQAKPPIKVLLVENVNPSATAEFERQGYQVESIPTRLSEPELIERARGVQVLGHRSGTNITADLLQNTPNLLAVGAFCIGTNRIDLAAASEHGVAVFNAPFSSGRSVAELALTNILALKRHLGDKSRKLHEGVWDKSAAGSHEARGRRLGIAGYGNIGSQLSVLAESIGLEVYFYDVADKPALGNARKCQTLDELLQTVDVLSVHMDGRSANQALFGEREFALMKPGSLFINLARASTVDTAALGRALESGHLGGAAIDVHDSEPKSKDEAFHSPLQNLPNVILTPHVGGNTEEAQIEIGSFVSRKIIRYIETGNTSMSVNLPNLNPEPLPNTHRLMHLHRNTPGVLAKINTILAAGGINIEGQALGTKGDIGYVITDVNTDYPEATIDSLRALSETIRLRVLS